MKPPWRVPLALIAAWTINDIEEWFTMAPWSAKNAHKLQQLPVSLPWPAEGMPAAQAHAAIGIVGAGIVAAAIRGGHTAGRSSFYRASLLAFGIHGLTHLAQAAALRGYTPGAVTAATTVLPFWAWAEYQRKQAGDPPYTRPEKIGAALIIASLPAIVRVAGALTQPRHR